MQRGSDEHHVIDESASSNTRTMFALSPCRASPPRVPSASGILGPIPRLANEMAPWALKPAREANTDELAGAITIPAGCYLGRDGGQPEATDSELLLEPRARRPSVGAQPRRRSPAVSFRRQNVAQHERRSRLAHCSMSRCSFCETMACSAGSTLATLASIVDAMRSASPRRMSSRIGRRSIPGTRWRTNVTRTAWRALS